MLSHAARVGAPVLAVTAASVVRCDPLEIPEPKYVSRKHGLPTEIRVHKVDNLKQWGLPSAHAAHPSERNFVNDDDCVLAEIVRKGKVDYTKDTAAVNAYPRAGPKEELHFEPREVRAAIVNCGGLCPGLNNVIKGIVEHLSYGYGVETIYGVRGGYRGFHSQAEPLDHFLDMLPAGAQAPTKETRDEWAPVLLNTTMVADWHREGGTNLSSARGGYDEDKIVEFLERHRINQVYVIGGDGTHRGAYRLANAVAERKLNTTVCGVPKTIDNDVGLIDYSFGFRSAVQAAQNALMAAEVEAKGNMPNGIGVVKLMGRSSGYIAAYSTIANGSVDLCLVPEVPVELSGPGSVLSHLEEVVARKGYAVAVVAEGAGEEVLGGASTEVDAGGNKKLPPIGKFLVDQIVTHFKGVGKEATVKYIDPSYMVRSVPASSDDAYYCHTLAAGAVHASMAGFTGFSVGMVNNHSVLIPIPALVAKSPRTLNPEGRTWDRVVAITGQPRHATPQAPLPSKAIATAAK